MNTQTRFNCGLFVFAMLSTTLNSSSPDQQDNQSKVAHTEYVATHSHGDLRVVHVESPANIPFTSLFQLYEFEFVPHTHKEVGADGHYSRDLWSEAGADIYLLYCGESPIGFAVVNHASMIDGNKNVRDIAEFFIMPSHRRRGCGKWLAHALFDRHPGRWEIRQLPHHPAIRKFWCEAIRAYVGDSFTDTDMNSAAWVGPLQTFNTENRLTTANATKQTAGGNQYSYILKASPGKGIGVFALHDIPAGAAISDRAKFKVKICKRDEVPQELAGYCIHLKGDEEIVPERFDQMPIFWYLNHSETPNVIIPDGISIIDGQWLALGMRALKDIKAGEELCSNYNELGEPEEHKEDYYRTNKETGSTSIEAQS